MEQVSAVEDQYWEICDAHADALGDLVSMQAPSLADLVEKMEMFRRAGVFDGSRVADAMIGGIIDDLRRLGGVA
ncbi:MAG TPA: hypothetical protein VFX27_07610 [Sphingobium sp.]|nr:hypothetical protein [Sphingobium sp.]